VPGVGETTCTRTTSVGHQRRIASVQATINQRMTMTMEGRANEVRGGEVEDGGGGGGGRGVRPMTKSSHWLCLS
jgi:hypothetical protein